MKRTLGVLVLASLLLAACSVVGSGSTLPGIAMAPGSFSSNGEQIYFTSIDTPGNQITYTGGPAIGGMMRGGYLACVSCHGPGGRGGVHVMMMGGQMDAPDIRWPSLAATAAKDEGLPSGQVTYTLTLFRQAVIQGKDAAGEALKTDMPRWQMSDQDLADLATYLQSLP